MKELTPRSYFCLLQGFGGRLSLTTTNYSERILHATSVEMLHPTVPHQPSAQTPAVSKHELPLATPSRTTQTAHNAPGSLAFAAGFFITNGILAMCETGAGWTSATARKCCGHRANQHHSVISCLVNPRKSRPEFEEGPVKLTRKRGSQKRLKQRCLAGNYICHPPIHPSIHPSTYSSVNPPYNSSIKQSIHLFFDSGIHPSIYVLIQLFSAFIHSSIHPSYLYITHISIHPFSH